MRTFIRMGAAAAIATSLCLATACSSSSSSGGGGTSPSSSQGSTATGSGSGAPQGGNAEVAAAQAFLDKYSATPTSIPATTPLTSKPASGQTFAWLQCDAPNCAAIGSAIKAATAAIGWKYKSIAYKSANPATLTAAFRQALQMSPKPSAVGVSGIDANTGWSAVLPAYKAAKIPIVQSFLGDSPIQYPIVSNIAGAAAAELGAKLLADWTIVDSKANASVVVQRTDDFAVLKAVSDGYEQTLKAGCAKCTTTDIKSTIPDLVNGNVVGSVVAKVRTTPSARYAILSDAEYIDPLPSQLAAANRSNVKVMGVGPDVTAQQGLKQGKFGAFATLATSYAGWLMLDSVLRSIQGMPQLPAAQQALPEQLLTRTSTFTVEPTYNQPTNYPDLFKQLWKIS